MDTFASWAREVIASQPWLAWAQPYVARAPDWALLAAPLLVLLVLLVAVAIFWPRKRSPPKKSEPSPTQVARPAVNPVAPARQAAAQPSQPSSPPTSPTPAASVPPTQKPAPTDEDSNRAVRVFVSSTFLDMQRERDVLVRQTFPALRAKFRARGVELLEVDLRWGITQEQSESGKTLPTLLAEIDRCRPYFIGLLGERYGSVPPASALTDELRASYPSIADAAGRSITDMEIIHGVLRNPESAKHAIFFERDPAWLDTQSAEERAQYVADSDEARAKLADLKARILASGARIIAYAKPEDIGPAVEAALIERIEAQFPEADAPDAFTQTARLHAAYARERRGLHIGAAPYMSTLDAWIAQTDAKPMLITGASGGGKSTLVANWLAHHRSTAPNDIVFEHYLGASPDSADPILLIRRLWEHINRATGGTVEQPSDERALIDGLPQRLAQAHAFAERSGSNILIVLDGLDKLSSQQDLRWLPTYFPPRVRLLASSLDGDARAAAEVRDWVTLEVKPLTDAERREFIDSALRNWGRALSRARTERILASPLSGAPLFLKTLLDELRVATIESELNARLDDYLAARDIPDLFGRVLQRLESDCGADFVRTASSLVWASRAGLEETEIIAITGATPLAWAVLRNGLGDGLRDQAGRLAFSHDYISQAVAARYLDTDDKKRAAHLSIADQFDKREPDVRQAEELPFQLRAAQAWDQLEALLVDLDRFKLLRARGDGELLSYWVPLKTLGRDPEALLCGAFEARAGKDLEWSQPDIDFAGALISFLRFCGATSDTFQRLGERRTAACARLFGWEHPETITSMSNLAETVSSRGELELAQKLQEHVLKAASHHLGPEHANTLTTMNNLAATIAAAGNLPGAQELQERVVEGRARLLGPEHSATLTSMSNLANTLRARGDLAAAQALGERVVASCSRLLGLEHPDTLVMLNNLSATLHARGDFSGAQRLQENIVEVGARLLGAEHPSVLTSMNNLAQTLCDRGDFSDAQGLQERVVNARTRLLGAEHTATLTSINNLSVTLTARGDFAGAQRLQEGVVETSIRVLGAEHPDTLRAVNNLAATLSDRGDYDAAQKHLEQVFMGYTRLFGMEHPSTLTSMNNIAEILAARGDLAGAQTLHERVLEASMRTLGSEHPSTLRAMGNLAGTLSDRGDHKAALTMQVQVFEGYTRLLGPEHPDTKNAANGVVAIRRAMETRKH